MFLVNDLTPREKIVTQQSRHADRERKNKEKTADSERENPLQLQNR